MMVLRRAVLFCLFISFCCFSNLFASDCKKVESFVEQVHTVNGKVVRERIKVEIEPVWSIHGGYYPNVYIPFIATSGQLVFNKNGKQEKTDFKFVNTENGSISKNLNLKKLIEEWVHRSPARVELKIMNNDKLLCSKIYPVVVGE